MVLKGHKDHKVQLVVPKDLKVFQDHKDHKVPKGLQDQPDPQVRVPKDHKVLKELQVLKDHKVLKV